MAGFANMGPDELRERLRQFDRAVALLYRGSCFDWFWLAAAR